MNAHLRKTALVLLVAGCQGIVSSGGSSNQPPGAPDSGLPQERFDAGPACGGEQYCVAPSQLARISVPEYQQTVNAAFGTFVSGERFEGLPSDGRAGPFWSNDESAVNDDSVSQYRLVAEHVAATVVAKGAGVLKCQAVVDDACLNLFLARTARALFRNEASASEITLYRDLFRATESKGNIADATRVTIAAMLQSPEFLYQLPVGVQVQASVADGVGEVLQLSGAALANRLAYFLWGAPPDGELLAAAARGDLDSIPGLEREARRLLLDPRSDRRLGQFHTQWLGLEDLPFRTFPSTQPAGYDSLRLGFYSEVQAFGARVVREEDAKVSTLLTADWTMVDAQVGAFYGVQGLPAGVSRVTLPSKERAGLLTQAGFLATHLHDASTQAVHRGKAIRELLLCQTIPPPPANIDPRITADPMLSPRQRLEAKTRDPSCQGCHQLMNPIGFTLERFDVWGRYRNIVDDPSSGLQFAVDARGGVSNADLLGALDGHIELTQALAKSEVLHRCVTRQWFRFGVGRSESKEDEKSIDFIWERYQASGQNLRELIIAIAISDPFRFRRYQP
jgi:Protein of unknown function (DUF1588)/Protein of unknown function (DUF1592)/Protein of unknown function (DUF1585)/Protein of unknown function (DUF1595)/Protein of unknown function (DUF1587)